MPTCESGRTPPASFGCVLTTTSGNDDVRLMLDQSLEPGMTRRVSLMFLLPEAMSTILPGVTFGLWEGREIGFGRIEPVRRADPIAA